MKLTIIVEPSATDTRHSLINYKVMEINFPLQRTSNIDTTDASTNDDDLSER